MKKLLIFIFALTLLLSSCNTVQYNASNKAIEKIKTNVSFTRVTAFENSGPFMWRAGDNQKDKLGDYPYVILDSFSEFNSFKKQAELFFDLNSNRDESGGFEKITADFDNSFFENNTVFVVYFNETSGSIRHKVSSSYIQDSVLSITIDEKKNSGAVTDDMADWLAVFTFDKNEIEKADSFLFLAGDSRPVSNELYERPFPEGTAFPVEVYQKGIDFFVFDNDDSKELTYLFKSLDYNESSICECDSTEYLIVFSEVGAKYALSTKEGYVRKINISDNGVIFGEATLNSAELTKVKLIMSRLETNL